MCLGADILGSCITLLGIRTWRNRSKVIKTFSNNAPETCRLNTTEREVNNLNGAIKTADSFAVYVYIGNNILYTHYKDFRYFWIVTLFCSFFLKEQMKNQDRLQILRPKEEFSLFLVVNRPCCIWRTSHWSVWLMVSKKNLQYIEHMFFRLYISLIHNR